MVSRSHTTTRLATDRADPGAILHYIFDPFCGWCYAAAPLLDVALQLSAPPAHTLRIQLHAGGMMMGSHRQLVTAQLRDYVLPHDARIEALTGQAFSAAYRDGLLRDRAAVFDSEPPITAILAAESAANEQRAGLGLKLLKRLQHAHYVEGRRIAEWDVLLACAVELGIAAADFRSSYQQLYGPATQQHVDASRRLLAQVGGRGFPTLVWQHGNALSVLPWDRYLGEPMRWREVLLQALSALPDATIDAETASNGDAGACAIDGQNC